MNYPTGERPMYRWRRMTPDEREQALAYRQQQRLPLHSPPHYASDTSFYLITAACYEHRAIIGHSNRRIADFEASLLYVLHNAVKHGYVEQWQHWPFCSAAAWLEEVGRERAERMWREFPIDDFGATWDPPEL